VGELLAAVLRASGQARVDAPASSCQDDPDQVVAEPALGRLARCEGTRGGWLLAEGLGACAGAGGDVRPVPPRRSVPRRADGRPPRPCLRTSDEAPSRLTRASVTTRLESGGHSVNGREVGLFGVRSGAGARRRIPRLRSIHRAPVPALMVEGRVSSRPPNPNCSPTIDFSQ
jgi:hypothetical protein